MHMLVENATSAWGQSREWVLHKHKCIQITARVPKAQVLWCMHECLCKTHSRDCPHGEVAFSNSNINKKQCTIKICQITSFMSTMGKWHLMISFHHSRQIYYGEMIHYDFISPWWIITYCNLTTNLLWWNDTLWFHFTIVDYYILQFDKFLSYKDIRRKAFFTMATLLMLPLENAFLPRFSNSCIGSFISGCMKTNPF